MRNKVLKILQVVLALIFCISAGILCKQLLLDRLQNQSETRELKHTFLDEEPDTEDQGEKAEELPEDVALVDLDALKKDYPDIQAWITIPDTMIDYPVMQSTEKAPQYYLRRNYKKEWDINGSLFFQWNCKVPEGENLIIYGHNMNSGVQFGDLDLYLDADYERSHSRIFLQTLEGMEVFRIMAVLKADVDMFPFQQVNFSEDHTLDDYIQKARQMSLYEIEELTEEELQVLTLITCAYDWREARLIIVAVREP